MADKDLEKVSGGSLGNRDSINRPHGSGTGRGTERTSEKSLAGGLAGGFGGGLGGGLADGLAAPLTELRRVLADRLPAGTVLSDDILAKLAGGIIMPPKAAPANDLAFVTGRDDATDSNLMVKSGRDDFGVPVLLGDMPAQFASLEELERWIAEREKKLAADKLVNI